MKYILLATLLFSISIKVTSQSKRFLYYFDKDFNSATKEHAVFNGVGAYVNDLLELRVYNAQNKNLVFLEDFSDSSLHEADGLYKSFYPDGNAENEGSYVKGTEDGLWQKWDSTRLVIDSSFYDKGTLSHYIHRGYYKSGFADSVIIFDLQENGLAKTFYNDSGSISNEVFFTGEKGLVKYYDKKGILTGTDSVFTRDEIEASFPGGEVAWTNYIVKGLQNNGDALLKQAVYGTCHIRFIVGKDGKVKEVEATDMKGTKLAETGMRIIRSSPKWKPASQYGRFVNAYRIQPVTLSNPD